MKKYGFIIILVFCLFFQGVVFANLNYNDVFVANIQYDWIDKSMIEKEALIDEIRDVVFENDTNIIPDLKMQYESILKDKNYKEHYIAASAGLKDYKEVFLSAFYYKKQKHIYMYGIQQKSDRSKTYYYDALGKLRYIDFNYGEYPDYPYTTVQYDIKGNPISAIYYVSKDTQYLYEPDGTFKGLWYKHNLYNEYSKVILTRTYY